jgi:glycosyltransferase involved in cell wall biosynthesis
MKVAFYGNIANIFYQIVKALREQSSIDAHLYIDVLDPMGMRPESDTPTLKNHYPHWIHQGRYLNRTSILFPWRSELIKELQQYDLVMVSYLGPMFSQFIQRPAIFFTTGSDLTFFPFPRDFRFLYKSLYEKIIGYIKGYWQRGGIRRVQEIWTQPFTPFTDALEKLGIPLNRISPVYFPLIIDTQKFKYDEEARFMKHEHIQEIVSTYDFVIFHPSRMMIQDHPSLKASGQWKRNDLLFRGFAHFLEKSGSKRSALLLPDRTQSNDLALAKKLIVEMGLESHVFLAKPPRSEGFTRDELIHFYSISDVVTDNFSSIGWFGNVVLEGLAMSRPVISYIDEEVMGKLYPWHPILSANTEEGIADHLMALYDDPKYKWEVGCKGREWIEEFHSGKKTSALYVKQIMGLCDRIASGPDRVD